MHIQTPLATHSKVEEAQHPGLVSLPERAAAKKPMDRLGGKSGRYSKGVSALSGAPDEFRMRGKITSRNKPHRTSGHQNPGTNSAHIRKELRIGGSRVQLSIGVSRILRFLWRILGRSSSINQRNISIGAAFGGILAGEAH